MFFGGFEQGGGQPMDWHFHAAVVEQKTPELPLRADRSTRYEAIAHLMAAAQAAGLVRIAFVTDPGAAHFNTH